MIRPWQTIPTSWLWKTPELVEGRFVDGEFRDHLTDRLYRMRTVDGVEALLYNLLEHKSWPISSGGS
ncbi:MAG: Rpn family recombination-promoting nuclease/putative transposase [Magnetococcales bacterium]|nr:Rpn family recombination-promoting nuclease/putative transposase [Magnetococcales bacterium]